MFCGAGLRDLLRLKLRFGIKYGSEKKLKFCLENEYDFLICLTENRTP